MHYVSSSQNLNVMDMFLWGTHNTMYPVKEEWKDEEGCACFKVYLAEMKVNGEVPMPQFLPYMSENSHFT